MKSDLRNSSNPSVSEPSLASDSLLTAHVSLEEGHDLANALRAAAYVECSSKDDMEGVCRSFQMLSWLALSHHEGGQGWPAWKTLQSWLRVCTKKALQSVQDIVIAVFTIAVALLGRGASILRRVAFSGHELSRSRPGPPYGPLLPPCREMS